jgi:hypothetical protein
MIDDIAKSRSDDSMQRANFWRNMYAKFNPEAAQQTKVNASPMYDASRNATMASMQPTGYGSAGDLSDLISSTQGQYDRDSSMADMLETQRVADANYGSLYNKQLENQKRSTGINRFDETLSDLPVDHFYDMQSAAKQATKARDAYKASRPSGLARLAGVAGTLLGGKLGGMVGGKNKQSGNQLAWGPPKLKNTPTNTAFSMPDLPSLKGRGQNTAYDFDNESIWLQ